MEIIRQGKGNKKPVSVSSTKIDFPKLQEPGFVLFAPKMFSNRPKSLTTILEVLLVPNSPRLRFVSFGSGVTVTGNSLFLEGLRVKSVDVDMASTLSSSDNALKSRHEWRQNQRHSWFDSHSPQYLVAVFSNFLKAKKCHKNVTMTKTRFSVLGKISYYFTSIYVLNPWLAWDKIKNILFL